jgi:hypothetical protein
MPCYRAWGLHVSQRRCGLEKCRNFRLRTSCGAAAFFKESRMKFAEPSKLNRNPGGWGTRCFAALRAVFLGFVQGDGGLYLAPAMDTVMGFVTTIVRSIEEQAYAA